MTFRYKIDLEEQGRTPLLLGDVRPRNKAKETVVRFLNRFIEAVRYTTEEFWVEQVRYQDLLSYNVAYWNGTNYLQGRMSLIDSARGVGGIKIGGTPPFQVDNQTLDNLKDLFNQ